MKDSKNPSRVRLRKKTSTKTNPFAVQDVKTRKGAKSGAAGNQNLISKSPRAAKITASVKIKQTAQPKRKKSNARIFAALALAGVASAGSAMIYTTKKDEMKTKQPAVEIEEGDEGDKEHLLNQDNIKLFEEWFHEKCAEKRNFLHKFTQTLNSDGSWPYISLEKDRKKMASDFRSNSDESIRKLYTDGDINEKINECFDYINSQYLQRHLELIFTYIEKIRANVEDKFNESEAIQYVQYMQESITNIKEYTRPEDLENQTKIKDYEQFVSMLSPKILVNNSQEIINKHKDAFNDEEIYKAAVNILTLANKDSENKEKHDNIVKGWFGKFCAGKTAEGYWKYNEFSAEKPKIIEKFRLENDKIQKYYSNDDINTKINQCFDSVNHENLDLFLKMIHETIENMAIDSKNIVMINQRTHFIDQNVGSVETFVRPENSAIQKNIQDYKKFVQMLTPILVDDMEQKVNAYKEKFNDKAIYNAAVRILKKANKIEKGQSSGGNEMANAIKQIISNRFEPDLWDPEYVGLRRLLKNPTAGLIHDINASMEKAIKKFALSFSKPPDPFSKPPEIWNEINLQGKSIVEERSNSYKQEIEFRQKIPLESQTEWVKNNYKSYCNDDKIANCDMYKLQRDMATPFTEKFDPDGTGKISEDEAIGHLYELISRVQGNWM